MSKPQIVALKVKFTLNAKNGLRRVIFGLEKDTKGDEIQWVINFQLFERQKKTDEFGDALVDVDVEVDQALNKQADSVSKNGLTTGQAAHVLGPGADDEKAAKSGEISEDEAHETVQATLKKK